MALDKHFLHINFKSLGISKFRFFAGIIIGFFYALIIYAFLYMIREVLRLSSLEEHYDFLILSDSAVNFYNYLYAFLALLFGQSICLSYWLDTPKKFKGKRQLRKRLILHDQRFLNAYFLSWVSKLAFIFWVFFIIMDKGFYAFGFYPSYRYLFFLFLIVLYLQTWQNIRLVFKNRSLKWLLISFIVISTFSFGISKINLINYKAINTILKQKDFLYNYTLELPKSDIYTKFHRPHLTVDIYVAQPQNVNETNPVIFINNQKFSLNEIGAVIKGIQATIYDLEIPYMLYRLHVHKTIKMKFVNSIKNELQKVGASRIGYSVTPLNAEFNPKFYTNLSLNFRMPIYNDVFFNLKDTYKRIKKIENIIKLRQLKNGRYLINVKEIDKRDFTKLLKKQIERNLDYIILFYSDDAMSYFDYIFTLSSVSKAIDAVRNDCAFETYSESFHNIDRKEIREVKRKIPFIFMEITPKMLKEIKE